MIVCSFDPGLSGAGAVLDHNGLRAVFDIPTMPIPGVGPKALVQRKLDAHALCQILLDHCPAAEGKPQVVIEAVGTMGGKNNSVQTQGSLMRTLGALESVVECLGFPLAYVAPQTWKRFYGLIDSDLSPAARKAKALERARTLYPACADIGRARDHNRAESILIAHWQMRRCA